MLASGQRVGAFVVFADENGVRYAVRLGSVLALRARLKRVSWSA